MQCLVVGLACQFGVDVTQIFVGCRVAGVGAYGHFQRGAGLVKLALAGVQHRQIVVRLGQFGVVLRQAREGADGVSRLAAIALNHAFKKTHLRVFGLGRQVLIGFGHGLSQLAGTHQLGDVGVLIGMGIAQ